jgi:raffinose/stachyose/melibiose transport system permease protein
MPNTRVLYRNSSGDRFRQYLETTCYFPQIFLSDPNKMPLPVGLIPSPIWIRSITQECWPPSSSRLSPTIFVYSILHEKIIEGMSAGAVKG